MMAFNSDSLELICEHAWCDVPWSFDVAETQVALCGRRRDGDDEVIDDGRQPKSEKHSPLCHPDKHRRTKIGTVSPRTCAPSSADGSTSCSAS
ncbi:hypothetical protein [Streptosporangium lutulentum]|uniref:Uncharacterized protein n=1 Tax=Streptosporangium lutulentum TaxID=1461250 RepID=A0ABT9QBQ7_9ACTN|nr:hypothetical protein [Streptosporangium lutulentum]MDP9843786.1 hypothetical protein [Streptosporangium lutulentum]